MDAISPTSKTSKPVGSTWWALFITICFFFVIKIEMKSLAGKTRVTAGNKPHVTGETLPLGSILYVSLLGTDVVLLDSW